MSLFPNQLIIKEYQLLISLQVGDQTKMADIKVKLKATGQTGTPNLTSQNYTGLQITYPAPTTVKTGNQQRMDWYSQAYIPIEDAADFRQGTKSLRFTKVNIAANNVTFTKTMPAVVDSLNQEMVFWIKIKDATALGKISSIEVSFGSSTTNKYMLAYMQSDFTTGWQQKVLDPTNVNVVTTGLPNYQSLNYASIKIITNNATDVLSSGDVLFDWMFFATTTRYIGQVIRFIKATGTMPDNATAVLTTYKPLSKEVACTSEAVGIKYNVGRNKIVFKVSVVANIDNVNNYNPMINGTDIESDDALRSRVQYAAQSAGKATVEALRQAVLAVNGVTSVNVIDLPLKTQLVEPHTYLTITQDYTLNNEIALDDGTLLVTGTASALPYTFVKGTDYILVDSKIRFQIGGTNPDNATTFLTSYDYDWLGHVEIYVSGSTSPLPVSVTTAVTTAITDTKAAGVTVNFYEPTVVLVDVTCSILANISGGFTYAAVAPLVQAALEEYLNSLSPGGDVYLASLFQVIQNVEGVQNSTITIPVGDTAISVNQIARSGNITVGSL